MERRELLAATGALAVTAVAGCVDPAPVARHGGEKSDGRQSDERKYEPEPVDEDAIPDEELKALTLHNAAFGPDIYQSLAAESDKSLFLSLYSISLALAMTYAGATGETAQEMEEALRFEVSDDVHARSLANSNSTDRSSSVSVIGRPTRCSSLAV